MRLKKLFFGEIISYIIVKKICDVHLVSIFLENITLMDIATIYVYIF